MPRRAGLPHRLRAFFDALRTENFEKKKIRGRKICGPKSREIAPKSMSPGGAQLGHDP